MMTRRFAAVGLLALLVAAPISAATYQTENFIVHAPTPQLAQEFGGLAEHFRKVKAREWLGSEMPAWRQKCPLHIKVTNQGAGGATQFNFGQVITQTMEIEGSLDRLRDSVLPHEVTHTVFAHHFRRPVPRWADEGGSVLSEDDLERKRHDRLSRQLLNAGRGMPLRRLFTLSEYPRDVMVLYAQGYSVSQFLVDRGGRQKFLNFVSHGMQFGWDAATRDYGFRSVKEMEGEWLEYLRTDESLWAYKAGPQPGEARTQVSEDQVTIRDFAPPAQPTLAPPIVARGASPESGSGDGWNSSPVRYSESREATAMPRPRTPAKRPPVILLPPEPIDFR